MKTELLLIDDDPFTLALAQRAARGLIAAHKILIFSSAKDALEYLSFVNNQSGKPADRRGLICSDLEMPDMDGFGFLDAFAELPACVREKYKVFIVSSCKDESTIARLYDKRYFEGFACKPLTVEKLRFMVQQTIDR